MPTLPMKKLTIGSQSYEVSGTGTTFTVEGHSSPIGDMPTEISSTYSCASGTTIVSTGLGFSLTAGKWILIASVSFPAGTSGYRTVGWGSSSALEHSRMRISPSGGSYDYVQSVAEVNVTSTLTEYVRVQQNSGSAMTVNVYARAIRIA